MQITKEFRICEVKAARVSNAPYEIILENENLFARESKSSLTLDTDACDRNSIRMSFDLVGRTLICSFESRKLKVKADEPFRWDRKLSDEDLHMKSLERKEETLLLTYTVPPSKNSIISQKLELKTLLGGGRLSPMPCPFYHFFLDLTDKEYRTVKTLSASTVFRASFSLKVGEPESESEFEHGAS